MKNFGLCLSIFFALSLRAGGLTVGNGGGLGESNFHYAVDSFPRVLTLLSHFMGQHDAAEREQLARLGTEAAREAAAPHALRIVKDSPDPAGWHGRDFILDPGGTLYLRLDALYALLHDGSVRPLSYAECLTLVTRILGARIGSDSDAVWSQLGGRLARIGQSQSEVLYYGIFGKPDYSMPSFTLLQNPHDPETWALLVTDATKVFDLLPSLVDFVKTRRPALSKLRLAHLSWNFRQRLTQVEASLATQDSGSSWSQKPQRIRITLGLKESSTDPGFQLLDPARVTFEVIE